MQSGSRELRWARRSFRMASTAAILSLLFTCTSTADTIKVKDVMHEDVVVKEDVTEYVVLVPDTGAVLHVPKSDVVADSIAFSDPDERSRLLSAFGKNQAQRLRSAVGASGAGSFKDRQEAILKHMQELYRQDSDCTDLVRSYESVDLLNRGEAFESSFVFHLKDGTSELAEGYVEKDEFYIIQYEGKLSRIPKEEVTNISEPSDERFESVLEAAQSGETKSQYQLAKMYFRGEGVAQDYDAAAKWFRNAAERGHAGAQFYLGLLYEEGIGILQDYREAMEWYRRAAEQGESSAQNNLGVMFSNGIATIQDYVTAHMWFNLGAAAGSELSRKNRDGIAELMTVEQIAEAQSKAREWQAAHATAE